MTTIKQKIEEILAYKESCPTGSHPIHNSPAYGCMNLNTPTYNPVNELKQAIMDGHQSMWTKEQLESYNPNGIEAIEAVPVDHINTIFNGENNNA